ncbi:DUF1835 domain-containing protein [Formosa algae]|uniref:DUF1835 domain-containing protein n=1 Tax=Formosa algae TaxID=225843 RepID=A0A9X0YM96_9FLAO|nr:DUF1835 domain-containing protein [Formosa algae]MBP1841181.1 hypothetical protein [Formosa algae]MDQ0336399.1 hypothetical protein [Formosa algae]OEI81364.1 DUF1835 domain-containing protein [Formosa algae]
MGAKTLHITNGSSLTTYLNELEFEGDILTWHEMLCEGPTIEDINSSKFIQVRQQFLQEFYDIEADIIKVKQDLDKLDCAECYNEIILWFEYDLFCHINLIAVISLLVQKKIKLPVFLVCSGRVHGVKDLKGLSELSSSQLTDHYEARVRLTADDIDLARTLWQLYNGKDHNLLKPYIVKHSSFDYLSNCLKAHLQRFPNSLNGLSELELNILKIINCREIHSRNHLLGYALNYQGYYGYGDLQFERIIDRLSMFFSETDEYLALNEDGLKALNNEKNYEAEISDQMVYGGVHKKDFNFDTKLNKLVKATDYAN